MTKSRLLLLVTHPLGGRHHNDNHERLQHAFLTLGWEVVIEPHDYVLEHDLDQFEFIWPVGFGPKQTYDSRVRALTKIPTTKIVTPAEIQRDLHAKSAWLTYAPETHSNPDPQAFAELIQGDDKWVLKPNAGSFGRQVRKISAASELASITQHQDLWLLQRYVPEISLGEYRTVVIGSKVIGTYKRVPDGDFRANLARHGKAIASALPARHEPLVSAVHRELLAAGVGFAAIDTCAEYVMEVNVANPGGLQTLELLYGSEIADRVADACLLLVKEHS